MPSRHDFLDRFGRFLDRAPEGFSCALETRLPICLSRELFDFLTLKRIGFVYLDGYCLPPPIEIFETFQPAAADFAIIRLHGGDRKGMEEKRARCGAGLPFPSPKE